MEMLADNKIDNNIKAKSKKPSKASIEKENVFDKIAKKSSEENNSDEEYRVVEELNKEYAAVHTDQFYILREKSHHLFGGTDFNLESKQSFKNTFENKIIKCSDGKNRTKAEIWLKSPDRREYKGITFDPTSTSHKNGLYNIWKGFSIEPKPGKCDLFKDLVKTIICSGNSLYFQYVWKWMSHLIQKPDVIATGLVLMSTQGTGKGKFAKTLGKVLGKHFLHLESLERMLGNFNFHMKDAVLVFGDEAIWGGNKKDVGKIKAMVTEEYAMIEPKGKDAIPVRNFRHFILSSNEKWPVHLDPDDRRFLVLKVSEKRKEDFAYFQAIDKEIENGGLSALLYELLHEDISGFNPRELPRNTEAFEVKMMSAPSTEKYIYFALLEECFDLGNSTPNGVWKEDILASSIFEDYKIWCSNEGIHHETRERLGASLGKVIPSIEKFRQSRCEGDPKRPPRYRLPILCKAREEFQKAYKVGQEIWELKRS